MKIDCDKNEVCLYVSNNYSNENNSMLEQEYKETKSFNKLEDAILFSRKFEDDMIKRIILKEGNYYDVSIELTYKDSNLVIESSKGKRAILYGGQLINNKNINHNNVFWSFEVPEEIKADQGIRMILVNGELRDRARLPKEGTYKHNSKYDVTWTSSYLGGWERKPKKEELSSVIVKPEDVKDIEDIHNAEITVFHEWDDSLCGVEDIETNNSKLYLMNQCGHPVGSFNNNNYIIWNVKEGMTKPGQWYFDKKRKKIIYWPLEEENLIDTKIVVPKKNNIISFNEKANNITIRNISLRATNTPLTAGEFGAEKISAAIESKGKINDCTFENIDISNVSGHGIKISHKSKNIVIKNCEIKNLGAGGIWLGLEKSMLDRNNKINNISYKSVIENNNITEIGLIYYSAIGVYGRNCDIRHNEVNKTPYTGINCSGTKILVEKNIVSNIMRVLNDGAGIYTIGSKYGVIRNNIVKDIARGVDINSKRTGYYLDEKSEGWEVYKNLVVNCEYPSFNHMSHSNKIYNNIFINTT